jgi:hypothetical protein
MNVPNNRSLDRVVKIGTCQAGMCDGQAVAEISLDTLRFDPKTLEARAEPKSVKVCMRHKSWYFKYQETLLDRINPERKKRNGRKPEQRQQTNMGYSPGFAQRFRSVS